MSDKRYMLTPKSGLVLEGGGMRGVFTCGVLDNLMDRGVRFPYTIGVSAGACNGLSYMSGQRGRAKYSNIDLLDKYHYVSLKHLIFKGNIMDFDLLFEEFPQRIIPYDYPAFAACTERYEMVTTSCRTSALSISCEHRAACPLFRPSVMSMASRCWMAVSPILSRSSVRSRRALITIWWCSPAIGAIVNPRSRPLCRPYSIVAIPTCVRPSATATRYIMSRLSGSRDWSLKVA